jgi:hypothetical protein
MLVLMRFILRQQYRHEKVARGHVTTLFVAVRAEPSYNLRPTPYDAAFGNKALAVSSEKINE